MYRERYRYRYRYVYIYIYIFVLYIYTYREREREIDSYRCVLRTPQTLWRWPLATSRKLPGRALKEVTIIILILLLTLIA